MIGIYFMWCSATYCGMYAIAVWTHWPGREKNQRYSRPSITQMPKDVTLTAFELPSHRQLINDGLGEVKEALRVHFRWVQHFLKAFRNRWIRRTCLPFLFHCVFSASASTCSVDESTQGTSGWWILQIFSFSWFSFYKTAKRKENQQLLRKYFLWLHI